ncbi:MFSD2A [Branchiostoma lanceolatum]|uniref:MFSD2A protein n=1 Tax=Branchiostoma lanceolatum TaxID=7740 RepID=A0A8J9ZRC0_BRALA|nr:MFSD2A [Branchiostoma lanceolatum]
MGYSIFRMAAATIITIPAYVLSWYVPDIDNGGKIAWYLMFYSVYLVAQTAYTISHRTLLMYMTEVPADRDSATTYRILCHLSSFLLAILVHGQIVGAFGTTDTASCANSTITNTSTGVTSDPETGYLVSAGTTAAITVVTVSSTVFGVKEYTGSAVPGSDTSRGTLLKDIWEVCTFRPFADLVGVGILSVFGAILVVAASVSIMFIPAGRLDVLFIVLSLAGFGLAGPNLIPWTMLTDVADDFKIQKGKRRDMLFQTLYQSITITAILLASVTSLVALEIGGYQTGACTQPDSVAFTTRLLVSFIPAGVTLLSLVFLWRYQLTGERLQANKTVLEERRNQQTADSGNTGGTAPQPSLEMKSHDLPDKRGPVQLTYFGPYGSFRFKRP